ncbi:uncharacterized protein LOC121376812 [Gigantopelta aegis]|uniref:uncharacterized protein LOC121376812 n=1 Tax=Gigantopelta aegis TaxID=1735272 RepID=UPI001B88E20F|nr:uncharacterized protein LOC121376812 [Gigantopelta aegis]
MKFILLLICLVAVTVNHQAESGWIRWRRVWERIRRIPHRLGRDASEFDKNLDGLIDESELEDLFTTREARDILEMADKDGNDKIVLDEFQQILNEINKLE